MNKKLIKLSLRIALASAFLSAVADRFGLWPKEISAWGSMESFIEYTQILNPVIPNNAILILAYIVTALEIIFALLLLLGIRTRTTALLSGYTLLLFALAMTFTSGIKGAFDYSVFTAAAAAFSLASMDVKFLELDHI